MCLKRSHHRDLATFVIKIMKKIKMVTIIKNLKMPIDAILDLSQKVESFSCQVLQVCNDMDVMILLLQKSYMMYCQTNIIHVALIHKGSVKLHWHI